MTELKKLAHSIRVEEMKCIAARGFGHAGGALSATDCIAALYGKLMKYDAKNPQWSKRDRLVCSKGHAGPALYAALALKGFFPMDWLNTLNINGTNLPSHCDKNKTPGIDATTGSLGQGASVAAGIASSLKLDASDSTVYLILGDGEINEGQVWEMAMFASAKELGNLVAFVDRNKKQLDGTTDEILPLGDIESKFASFGWNAVTIDGSDPDLIAKTVIENRGEKPLCVVLDTIKGAGVPAIENIEFNHHIVVSKEMLDEALEKLG